MFPTRAVLGALSVVALIATQARTEEKEKEPDAILEIGGSGNWSLSGPSSFGPTVAIEFTPIENWLEIEVGTGPMFGKGISEWDTDIVFKKPFTLSDKVEIMIGAGPQRGNAFKHLGVGVGTAYCAGDASPFRRRHRVRRRRLRHALPTN